MINATMSARWIGLLISGLGLLAPALPGRAQTAPLCPTALAQELDRLIQQPEWQRFRWGILIQTVAANPRDRQTLYALDADRYFLPASTVKLMTTAALLHQLGPDYRLHTSVYQAPTTDATALYLVGRGDPSLDATHLNHLAEQLRDRGLTVIDQLWVDDHFFPGSAVNRNWEWEDVQAGYGAPVNSLIWQGNEIVFDLLPQSLGQPLQVQWRNAAQGADWQIENRSVTVAPDQPEFIQVGRALSQPILYVEGQLRVGSDPEDASISVPDPTAHMLMHWQQAIAQHGLQVRHAAIAPTPYPSTAVEIARIESPPLLELITVVNQQSDNLYAEALLKHLGQVVGDRSSAPRDATAAGLAVLTETLTALGVDPDSYRLADGSGLSRHNLVSPAALVQTLQAMAASPQADYYRDSLAIAGEVGTLRYRLATTPLAGHLRGKSGAVSGHAALAGYVDLPHCPEDLVFSVLINNTTLSGADMRQAIDAVLLPLARLRSCPA